MFILPLLCEVIKTLGPGKFVLGKPDTWASETRKFRPRNPESHFQFEKIQNSQCGKIVRAH